MNHTTVEQDILQPCPDKPNCVSSQAKDEKHFIEPLVIQASPSEARKSLMAVLSEFKRATVVDQNERYIRAEFVSRLFRFVDDVEFYFPDSDSKDTVIHIRSASRIGYSDLGVNRKRVEEIRRKLLTNTGN